MPESASLVCNPLVRVTSEGSVWRVTLDRPRTGNAVSRDMVDALNAALDKCEEGDARVVMLAGEGKHFCTGFDLSNLAEETDDSLLARFARIEMLLQRVHRAKFITIAVAHGRTVGAGADLFAACQHRLAAPETSFSFPGARGFGLVLGTRRLVSLVGRVQARHWIEGATTISVTEALLHGLATGELRQALTTSEWERFTNEEHASDDLQLRSAIEGNSQADDAHDLAALVSSAARKGLKQRIETYVEQSLKKRHAGSHLA